MNISVCLSVCLCASCGVCVRCVKYNTNKKLFLTLFASELKDNMDSSNYTELEESRKSLKTAYINLAKSFY